MSARMTRQHFILIADALAQSLEACAVASKHSVTGTENAEKSWAEGYDEGWVDGLLQVQEIILEGMCSALERTNDGFDHARFKDWVMKGESLRKLNESAERINRERELNQKLGKGVSNGVSRPERTG